MNLGIPPRNVRVGLDRHFFANTGAGTSTDAQPGHRSGGWHELRDHARSLGVALSRDRPDAGDDGARGTERRGGGAARFAYLDGIDGEALARSPGTRCLCDVAARPGLLSGVCV
jgi:hypothetical protein